MTILVGLEARSRSEVPMAARKPATKARTTAVKPATKTPTKAATKAKPKATPAADADASAQIDARIRDVGGWRGEALARMRALIREAVPEAIEEVKWRGTPVWSHHGILTTGETYAKYVKLTFAHGAALPDPSRLFNASLEGGTRRAIDIHEGEQVDARAFKALVKAAAALNTSVKTKKK